MVMNGNGKWQVAFWVMASLCYLWLAGLTTGVIANDRMREQCDKDITHEVSEVKDKIYIRLNNIDKQLARIEAKLGE